VRIFQVDAFTDVVFHGNPAAVCIVEGTVSDAWMQAVAAEMNLSETAFVRQLPGALELRWFTPVTEVELCGHATLAAAHVLFESGEARRRVEFATRSGTLGAIRVGHAISLELPALPAMPVAVPDGLAAALGTELRAAARSRVDLLVEVDDEATVHALRPDLAALARVVDADGVIVTAACSAAVDGAGAGAGAARAAGADFVSRYFAPAIGIDEDPVTGAAHCVLAPYWSGRLGRDRLVGYQASRRGGVVRVALGADRVELTGRAVTVFSGELR